ncbi:30S ribosomal protein S15 [candidate division TM6 bacterium RIFCSPHIGHO2_12_FULL_32_22]|nr:MAG: 30S ribosomal protein S15 [candidate division TM6 bacterium RIFCSPHIGHO2_12_FULL_32_22]
MSVDNKELLEKFKKHSNDSGSIEVQIVSLNQKIGSLLGHSQKNPKDHSLKRGLLRLVSRRRKFLDYVKKHNPNVYLELLKNLDLRK